MNVKEFIRICMKSGNDIFRKPLIIFPGVVLFLFTLMFSKIGGKVGYLLQTTPSNIAWVIFSLVIFLLVGGFISAGLIGMCYKIVRREKIGNSFFSFGRKFWFRNFLVLIIFFIFFNLINLSLFVFTKFMIRLENYFVVSPEVFGFLSLLIYFVWLVGIIIFFAFSNFFVVVKNLNVRDGINGSYRLVKKEYLAVLSLLVIWFAVGYFVGKIPGIFGEVINFVVVLPFVFLLLTRFVVES